MIRGGCWLGSAEPAGAGGCWGGRRNWPPQLQCPRTPALGAGKARPSLRRVLESL